MSTKVDKFTRTIKTKYNLMKSGVLIEIPKIKINKKKTKTKKEK